MNLDLINGKEALENLIEKAKEKLNTLNGVEKKREYNELLKAKEIEYDTDVKSFALNHDWEYKKTSQYEYSDDPTQPQPIHTYWLQACEGIGLDVSVGHGVRLKLVLYGGEWENESSWFEMESIFGEGTLYHTESDKIGKSLIETLDGLYKTVENFLIHQMEDYHSDVVDFLDREEELGKKVANKFLWGQ